MSVAADSRYGPAPLPARSRPGLRRAAGRAARTRRGELPAGLGAGADAAAAPLTDEDLQLTLFLCYELHYRGWSGVDDARGSGSRRCWRCAPAPSGRSRRRCASWPARRRRCCRPACRALADLVAADDGPPLAATLQRRADLERFREFVAHRSIYHLQARPTRTAGRCPGCGGPAEGGARRDPDRRVRRRAAGPDARRAVRATTMDRLGLDDRATPPTWTGCRRSTLADDNLMSLFGLHRRLRGALLGHLAAYEMTSSLPNRRYGNGLRRLGVRRGRHALLRRARRGRRRARADRRVRHVRRAGPGRAGARRRRAVRGGRRAGTWTASSPRTCSAPGRPGESSLRPPQHASSPQPDPPALSRAILRFGPH